jgi:hypothetical protein
MYEIIFSIIISTLTRSKKFDIIKVWDITWESCPPKEQIKVMEEVLAEAAAEVPKKFCTPVVTSFKVPYQRTTVPQTDVTILSVKTIPSEVASCMK